MRSSSLTSNYKLQTSNCQGVKIGETCSKCLFAIDEMETWGRGFELQDEGLVEGCQRIIICLILRVAVSGRRMVKAGREMLDWIRIIYITYSLTSPAVRAFYLSLPHILDTALTLYKPNVQ